MAGTRVATWLAVALLLRPCRSRGAGERPEERPGRDAAPGGPAQGARGGRAGGGHRDLQEGPRRPRRQPPGGGPGPGRAGPVLREAGPAGGARGVRARPAGLRRPERGGDRSPHSTGGPAQARGRGPDVGADHPEGLGRSRRGHRRVGLGRRALPFLHRLGDGRRGRPRSRDRDEPPPHERQRRLEGLRLGLAGSHPMAGRSPTAGPTASGSTICASSGSTAPGHGCSTPIGRWSTSSRPRGRRTADTSWRSLREGSRQPDRARLRRGRLGARPEDAGLANPEGNLLLAGRALHRLRPSSAGRRHERGHLPALDRREAREHPDPAPGRRRLPGVGTRRDVDPVRQRPHGKPGPLGHPGGGRDTSRTGPARQAGRGRAARAPRLLARRPLLLRPLRRDDGRLRRLVRLPEREAAGRAEEGHRALRRVEHQPGLVARRPTPRLRLARGASPGRTPASCASGRWTPARNGTSLRI